MQREGTELTRQAAHAASKHGPAGASSLPSSRRCPAHHGSRAVQHDAHVHSLLLDRQAAALLLHTVAQLSGALHAERLQRMRGLWPRSLRREQRLPEPPERQAGQHCRPCMLHPAAPAHQGAAPGGTRTQHIRGAALAGVQRLQALAGVQSCGGLKMRGVGAAGWCRRGPAGAGAGWLGDARARRGPQAAPTHPAAWQRCPSSGAQSPCAAAPPG